MEQDKPTRAHTATTPAPVDQAEAHLADAFRGALLPFLVDGEAARLQYGTSTPGLLPSAAARMFADLAARMAAVPDGVFPDDTGFSVSLSVQPFRLGSGHITSEADGMLTVQAVADGVIPGLEPSRVLMLDGSVHYVVHGMTAAGLHLGVFCAVEPTDDEVRQHAEREAERQAREAERARDRGAEDQEGKL